MTIFNPLNEQAAQAVSESGDKDNTSTSSLINDREGYCPKCKNPFQSATSGGDQVLFCPPCRVTQPMHVA